MSLRIGVSSCFFHADPTRPIFKGKTLLYAEESMLNFIMRLGAKAYLVPREIESFALKEYVDDLDGLVLQGGSDLSPESYAEVPIKAEWSGDRARDIYETRLITSFFEQKKPIFGICRGAQMINVAFGGTLYQDLESQNVTEVPHRNWDIYDENQHEVDLVENSHLSLIYKGLNSGIVNSVHHQGIKDLSNDFVVSALSKSDEVIEAIEYHNMSENYILGVQWHPEFHAIKKNGWLSPDVLMKDFLDACKK